MRSRHLVVFGVFILLVTGLTRLGWALPPPHDAGADARALDAAVDALGDSESADAGEDADPEAEAPAVVESAQPAPLASASAAPVHAPEAPREIVEGSPVRLHDKRVFAIRVKRAGITPEERARRASAALERAFEENEKEDVRVDESQPNLAVVMVGNRPIVELTPDDAEAAGDASLTVHAAGIGENVRSALKAERTRRDVSIRVLAWTLIIFSALALFLGVRKARDFAVSARTWISDNPKRLPALRIGSVEVMRPAAFQGLLRIGVTLIERTVQLAILYIWLVFVLSQFESTKDLGGKITTTILTPLGALVGRIALSLPLLVIAVIAVIAVFIVVRFIRLFFRSVEMGETQLAWLPPDLAAATSAVMRLGVVIGALVLGAPLVTGTDQGTASRAGFVVLAAMGLALVPIFASMSVGFQAVFWRRFRVGDFVSFDGRQGRVSNVTLFEIRVLDGEGSELRIPHLLTLVRPLRVSGAYPLATFEIVVDAKAPQEQVRKVMAASGASKHGEPRVRLLFADQDGAHYEIVAKRALDEEDPATAVLRALSDAGIGLGRHGGR
jgi:small-conductance mechanosensitive channel